jgi:hypothetical protein
MRHRVKWSVAVTLLAVLVGGCGSIAGVTLSQSQTKALNKAERAYISRADLICQSTDQALLPMRSQLQSIKDQSASQIAESVEIIDRGVKLEDAQLAKLEALPAPPADTTAIAQTWSALSAEIAYLKQYGPALNDLQFTKLRKLASDGDAAAIRLEKLASAYGFKVCGKPD